MDLGINLYDAEFIYQPYDIAHLNAIYHNTAADNLIGIKRHRCQVKMRGERDAPYTCVDFGMAGVEGRKLPGRKPVNGTCWSRMKFRDMNRKTLEPITSIERTSLGTDSFDLRKP